MMPTIWRWMAVAAILLAGWAAPPLAQADSGDTTADQVYGQLDFAHNGNNQGGLGASSLLNPSGVVLDRQGNLFVADQANNRVLEYQAPLATHPAASVVLGQPDFTHNDANHGGLSASSLDAPIGLALDASGNLFVADANNNRVLKFSAPFSTDEAASLVLGQPDFTHHGVNQGGLSARSLDTPAGVALDRQGNLYVADYDNNRVLIYQIPLATHKAAFGVLGQPDFAHNGANHNGLSAGSLHNPLNLTLDGQDNLYVADTSNNRVLEYNDPLLNDISADHVFGQPSFITNTVNTGGLGAASLSAPVDIALDANGALYVDDDLNNRVLEYNHPLTNQTADSVFGQGGIFTTSDANPGGLNANSLNYPSGLALDQQGNLYVADTSNNRVLEYDHPLTSDTTADHVFGQPDFTHAIANNGGLSAHSLEAPESVALDAQGDLYVADFGKNRVLEYNTPLTSDTTADRVFGQPDFTHGATNSGGLSASSLNLPIGVAVDAFGGLFVADLGNNRVLEFDNPLSDPTADRVFGQPNFITGTVNTGSLSAASLAGPDALTFDARNNLYVADAGNSRVLEYDWASARLYLPLLVR